MLKALKKNINLYFDTKDQQQLLFNIFALVLISSLFLGIATELYFLAGIPAFLLLAYITLVDFKKIFFLLLFFLPLSTEFTFPNGFGTDLPTEPLMIGLMGVYILYVLRHGKEMNSDFIKHPISLLLLLHIGWILTTTIVSDLFLVSLKFSLAKLWYLVVFYFMAGTLLKTEKDIRQFFWVIFLPLTATIIITLIRFKSYNFDFEFVHKVLSPYQRNHVNYAAMLAYLFPIICLAISWYKKEKWFSRALFFAIPVYLVGIYFSYTRAAYLAILIALGFYYIVRWSLVRWAVGATVIAIVVGLFYFVQKNTYLDYAPNYERTITHTDFDNLLEATYQLEDISTMERVYRWVAGFQMSDDHPWFGFGPGNFVNFYKTYTVTSFQTYVSRNKEQSGIHSYFLMTLVEQGIIGVILFFVLSFYILIKGEQIYHETTHEGRKRIIMMMLLGIVVIDAFLIINDLIETDKIGPFFFIGMAVLVNMDLENKRAVQR